MNTHNNEKTGFGTYDDKGHWSPPQPCTYSPLFEKPLKFGAFLRYLFGWGGFLWPRTLFYTALAAVTWFFLQPGPEVTGHLRAGWIGLMLLRNIVLIWIVFGGYHLFLYTFKGMGSRQKYNPKWMEKGSGKFLFKNQVWDNIFRSTVSGGIIWTAYEVLYMWAVSRGFLPVITWAGNPVWFIAFFLIIPIWREMHFYFVHRLIHWKPLLRAVHSVHHKNPNPGPWSGLSMHTVEHILYFSVVLLHFIVPSHPIHFFYDAQLTALTPAQGHTGFHGPYLKGILPAGDYFHYLHHRYVSCNFGTTVIPWDRWLGRFYNGEGEYWKKG